MFACKKAGTSKINTMIKNNISPIKIALFVSLVIFTVSHLAAQPPAPTPMKPEMFACKKAGT